MTQNLIEERVLESDLGRYETELSDHLGEGNIPEWCRPTSSDVLNGETELEEEIETRRNSNGELFFEVLLDKSPRLIDNRVEEHRGSVDHAELTETLPLRGYTRDGVVVEFANGDIDNIRLVTRYFRK